MPKPKSGDGGWVRGWGQGARVRGPGLGVGDRAQVRGSGEESPSPVLASCGTTGVSEKGVLGNRPPGEGRASVGTPQSEHPPPRSKAGLLVPGAPWTLLPSSPFTHQAAARRLQWGRGGGVQSLCVDGEASGIRRQPREREPGRSEVAGRRTGSGTRFWTRGVSTSGSRG